MNYYQVNEVMKILGVRESKAYQIIRILNSELKKNGYITVSGKVPKKYFHEKYYCDSEEIEKALCNH